jgi:curved DNA-binding protein CbpA
MDLDSLYSHSMYPENHNYQMRSNPSQRQNMINRINSEEQVYNPSLQRNHHSNYNQAQRNPHNHYVEVTEIEPFHASDFDDSIPLRGFANDWVSAIPSHTAFDDFFEDFSSFRHQNREIDTFNNRRQRSRGFDLFDSFTQSLFENFFNGFQSRLPVNRPRRHRERNLFEMLLSEFSNLDSFDIRPMHRFVRDPRQQAMDITELLAAMASMHPQGQRPANLNRLHNLVSVKMTSIIISSNTTCTVCQEDFKVGERAKKLECDHYFHEDCLMPWLQVQNTCPTCRNPV